jgi:hypothetical protein
VERLQGAFQVPWFVHNRFFLGGQLLEHLPPAVMCAVAQMSLIAVTASCRDVGHSTPNPDDIRSSTQSFSKTSVDALI